MKIRREVNVGEQCPAWYRPVWREEWKAQTVCYPVGLHWIAMARGGCVDYPPSLEEYAKWHRKVMQEMADSLGVPKRMLEVREPGTYIDRCWFKAERSWVSIDPRVACYPANEASQPPSILHDFEAWFQWAREKHEPPVEPGWLENWQRRTAKAEPAKN